MINWEKQWALFAKNFYDGMAHIELGASTLRLLPGPGFGDLSHPTTQLMLEMMRPYLAKEAVLDIGTGSGILALAALLLGARSAIGINIDPEAISHAKKNNDLNQLKGKFYTALPKRLPASIVLMNMIFAEQKMAFSADANNAAKLWITSGILASQEEEYLAQADAWGWKLLSYKQCSEWLCFVFDRKRKLS